MSAGIQRSFAYDTQVYSKISKHALKGRGWGEKSLMGIERCDMSVVLIWLNFIWEITLILITAFPN